MRKTYKETLDWMYRQLPMYQRQGASALKKNLDNIKALCKAMGNPESKQKYIHVAGTNGKGSVSHIIAGILQSQGYRVGMYTSPHYKDFRERIKINGEFISKRNVVNFVSRYQSIIEKIKPSFFEITVAMALDFFDNENPDFVIMEVGLGGRLDSTNVIDPLISVITNISFDHQSMLGNTLEEIAKEKGGIIKHKVPVVIGEHQATDNIFISLADTLECEYTFAEDAINIESQEIHTSDRSIQIKSQKSKWNFKVQTDLIADYQIKNIRTAFCTIEQLELRKELNININDLQDFFPRLKLQTYFIGRWQVLNHNPLTIADSAHNEDGILQLNSQIAKINYKHLHIVMGTVNDKDVEKMLRMFPMNAKYYYCKADIPRGLDAKILSNKGNHLQRYGKSYTTVKRAFAAARSSAHIDDLILIAGSIFVVAEVV